MEIELIDQSILQQSSKGKKDFMKNKKSSSNEFSNIKSKRQDSDQAKQKIFQQASLTKNKYTQSKQPKQENKNNQQNIEQEEDNEPKFYKSKKKRKQHKKDLQQNVAYPEATIRQYLNQKRTTQNKCCHVLFCIYMIAVIMLLGVGFFFGHFQQIGTLVQSNNSTLTPTSDYSCPNFVNENYTECVRICPSNTYIYLNKVCVQNVTSFNPSISTNLDKQISMYALNTSFGQLAYGSFISLILSSISFILLICFARLIYFYIGLTFVILIGFGFYLLKSVRDYMGGFNTNTIFYSQASSILPLAYILMAIYLIIFPIVLFTPKKIKAGVRIIQKMNIYFKKMSSVNFFSYLVIFVVWGLGILQILLVMYMFTSGQSQVQYNSFFKVFPNATLSHPAVLIVHFFGIYLFFGTVICWHKNFTSNAVCIWYFEDGSRLYPVKRGLKRSWYSLGTASLDALLMPVQWMMQVIYSMTRFTQVDKQKSQNGTKQDDQIRCCSCFYSIRQCFNSMFCKVNTHSSCSAPLTNYSFKLSCQISAVTFSHHNHKFYNIGNTIHILLILYNVLLWIIICYAILYAQLYSGYTVPKISSLVLPILWVFFISLMVGSLFSNIYTSALDTLIFCYLLQKRNNVTNTKNEVKDILQQIYNDDQMANQERVELFQYEEN